MSMPHHPLRWALVGLGDIAAKRVGPAMLADAGSQLYACVTRDPRRTSALLENFRPAQTFTRLSEALGDEEVDAVYLATPVDLHFEQTMASLKAGKHVLVEKPMALNATQARLMCEAAQRHERHLSVAYYRRYWERFEFIASILREQRLGKTVLVRMAMHQNYHPAADDPKRWRVEMDRAGGGVLMDVGSHRLDLLCWWFGLPNSVMAVVDHQVHEYKAEDAATALLHYNDGPQITFSVLWSTSVRGDSLEIVGTRGRLLLNTLDQGEIQLSSLDDDPMCSVLPRPANAHAAMIASFAAAIAGGTPPRFTATDGYQVSRLIEAIYDSSRSGARITLP